MASMLMNILCVSQLRAVLSEQDALETRAGLLIKLSEQGEQHKVSNI